CSVRLVICFDLAIDQIAQSGLSSLKVIYYSAQLFNELCLLKFRDAINGHILGSMTVLIIILRLSSNYCPSIYAAFIISTLPIKRALSR
ncbi:hypothetical protein, partial [Shigella sonnei]